MPIHFAPIPRISATPASPRRRRSFARSSGGESISQRLSLERPSPPPVAPPPAPAPVRKAAPAPVGVARPSIASSSHPDLTLLVWISFLGAAIAAGAVGVAHRVRAKPTGTNVFGRPTDEIDEWLASAEFAATTAPAPLEADPAEPPSDDAAGPPADTPHPKHG